MELFKAHRQWAERPKDERFQSLQDMHAACDGYRQTAAVASVPVNQLIVSPKGEDLVVSGPTGARIVEALDVAERREDRYGDPRSLWAAVSGLTEASQALPYADERTKVDRAAGKLLTIAF